MVQDAEILWEEALELEQAGEKDEALSVAKKVIDLDPEHIDAWMAIARLSLPQINRGKQDEPDLSQASSALSAISNVVRLDPENKDAWMMGGVLLVDHLGMMEESISWWEERRKIAPNEIMPLIEQISILIKLGLYKDASDRLELMFESDMESPDNRQLIQMDAIRKLIDKAIKLEKDEIFKPQDPNHKRWEIIRRMKDRKPLSETFFLFTFVAPIVFILGTFAMSFLGGSKWGFLVVFVIILILFATINRMASGLLDSLNRHVKDLERAIDVESSSGKLCISDEIRESKLYSAVMKKRKRAFTERMDLIIESNEKINPRWNVSLPEWN
tara:strand:+ start:5384 stop:6370 length:987 start_codon:yes stop_codon:yes gene_type:complete